MATKKVKVEKAETKPSKAKAAEKPQVTLVSFEVMATIPTQDYGNICPKITVVAPTIEIARDTVMPIIEDMYQAYARVLLTEKAPKFFNKASVVATEKKVDMTVDSKPIIGFDTSKQAPAPKKEAVATEEAPLPTYEAFKKAENAIASAVSREALNLVEEQIKKSVKVQEVDKPILFTLVLKKRKIVVTE
jgi:hypothetical protein